jgi:hypothetical protein
MPRAKKLEAGPEALQSTFEPAFKSGTAEAPKQEPGYPVESMAKTVNFGGLDKSPEERMNQPVLSKAQEDFKDKQEKAKKAFGFGVGATVFGASPNSPQQPKFVFN